MMSPFDLVVLGRAVLAAFLGMLVGWERKVSGASVGGLTVGLACFAAAVITAMAIGLFPTTADRIMAAVITGSGFLGAGIIIHAGSGPVRGLTTAASLWAMMAVGVVVGAGHELLGVVLALVIYVLLALNNWPILTVWLRRWRNRTSQPVSQPDSTPHDEAPSGRVAASAEPESAAEKTTR